MDTPILLNRAAPIGFSKRSLPERYSEAKAVKVNEVAVLPMDNFEVYETFRRKSSRRYDPRKAAKPSASVLS